MTSVPLNGFTQATPVFRCADLRASLDYYRNKLGFEVGWRWADGRFVEEDETVEVTMAMVCRDEVAIFLRKGQACGAGLFVAMRTLAEVDAVHADLVEVGARVLSSPTMKAWGAYEMEVEDLDGHNLSIAVPDAGAAPDFASRNQG